MKLYILRPKTDLGNNNPWKPWYGKTFGFIVRAEDEKRARKLADKEAGEENGLMIKRHPWLEEKYSTCIELNSKGKEEIIMQDVCMA
jgi:hypothetical protein